jgi:hypothetical protein
LSCRFSASSSFRRANRTHPCHHIWRAICKKWRCSYHVPHRAPVRGNLPLPA